MSSPKQQPVEISILNAKYHYEMQNINMQCKISMMIDDRFASEPLHQMPQRWEKLNYPTNGLLNQQRGDLQRESLGNLKQKTFQSLKQ